MRGLFSDCKYLQSIRVDRKISEVFPETANVGPARPLLLGVAEIYRQILHLKKKRFLFNSVA